MQWEFVECITFVAYEKPLEILHFQLFLEENHCIVCIADCMACFFPKKQIEN